MFFVIKNLNTLVAILPKKILVAILLNIKEIGGDPSKYKANWWRSCQNKEKKPRQSCKSIKQIVSDPAKYKRNW